MSGVRERWRWVPPLQACPRCGDVVDMTCIDCDHCLRCCPCLGRAFFNSADESPAADDGRSAYMERLRRAVWARFTSRPALIITGLLILGWVLEQIFWVQLHGPRP